MSARGYFGVGIFMPRVEENFGSLIRTAHLMGASFVFMIGDGKFKRQASDTTKAFRHLPSYVYKDWQDFMEHLPAGVSTVGVELDDRANNLVSFVHPQQAVYILGSERIGLPQEVLAELDYIVQIPSLLPVSLNVAVSGSIVIYDRVSKGIK